MNGALLIKANPVLVTVQPGIDVLIINVKDCMMECTCHTKHAIMINGREKEARWGTKRNAPNDSTSNGSTKSKLQLTNLMKQALVTEGNMSAKQATALWSKMAEN